MCPILLLLFNRGLYGYINNKQHHYHIYNALSDFTWGRYENGQLKEFLEVQPVSDEVMWNDLSTSAAELP